MQGRGAGVGNPREVQQPQKSRSPRWGARQVRSEQPPQLGPQQALTQPLESGKVSHTRKTSWGGEGVLRTGRTESLFGAPSSSSSCFSFFQQIMPSTLQPASGFPMLTKYRSQTGSGRKCRIARPYTTFHFHTISTK